MLFSEDLKTGLNELQRLLPFAASYDYKRVYPLLEDTEQLFLLPLLGDSLYRKLKNDRLDKELEMCRKAVANIMAYRYFTLLNTQIVPGGFMRLSGEGTATLYKYQEEELKHTFRRDGFDALDLIAVYFLNHLEDFPEFRVSVFYTEGRGEIVPDRFVFSRYYKPVGYVVFEYLRPFIRRAEELDVSRIVDLEVLRSGLLGNNLSERDKRLLELVRPLVVYLTVAYAVEDMGVNITDAGVWMENRIAGDGLPEKQSLNVQEAEAIAGKYRKLAERYMDEVQRYASGSGRVDVLERDNKGKKTVWL